MGQLDNDVTPPQVDQLVVKDLPAGQVVVGSLPAVVTNTQNFWVSIMVEAANPDDQLGFAAFVVFGGANLPDPDPAARFPDQQQCWRIPADFEFQRKLIGTSKQYKILSPTVDGVYRLHISSFFNGN